MAKIIFGTYMVRYPLGGMLSGYLQWIAGWQALGHEVVLVEKSLDRDSCFDPEQGMMSDDCSAGMRIVRDLLARHGLNNRICHVDAAGEYHGMSRREIESAFAEADAFIDMGTHGAWLEEAANGPVRVLIDGEPGFTQMKWENRQTAGDPTPQYDFHYTVGMNVGTSRSSAPTAGRAWHHVFHPVATPLFSAQPVPASAPFSTVMNWQSHAPLTFNGRVYGQKDVEFARFVDLPSKVSAPLELAVSGRHVPREELTARGWRLKRAHEMTRSVETFWDYIHGSRGEFGVCKNVFVATQSGWFSERSGAYLACGRPVVMQDTGISAHLPCGHGLLAVESADEAAAAIEDVCAHYDRHARRAREIACEFLDTSRVIPRLMDQIGIGRSVVR